MENHQLFFPFMDDDSSCPVRSRKIPSIKRRSVLNKLLWSLHPPTMASSAGEPEYALPL